MSESSKQEYEHEEYRNSGCLHNVANSKTYDSTIIDAMIGCKSTTTQCIHIKQRWLTLMYEPQKQEY